ncbi:hypothetical protein OXX79_000989 [Metschnikowia pulcherrima]
MSSFLKLMLTLFTPLFFALGAFTTDIILPGIIYVTPIGREKETLPLLVKRFSSSSVIEEISLFDFDLRGTVRLFRNTKYLAFDQEGFLVLTDEPHVGFSVTSKDGMRFTRKLSYNGTFTFYMCNEQIGIYPGICTDEDSVVLIYEDLIRPRDFRPFSSWKSKALHALSLPEA